MDRGMDHLLSAKLGARKQAGTLRSLMLADDLIDLNSNDYLGLARDARLKAKIEELGREIGPNKVGATASRLLAGNSCFAEALETEIAQFHQAPSALLFNSGYDANVGLYSSLGQVFTTLVFDELIHASVHDGMRLSKARCVAFRHNDPNHLAEVLQRLHGPVLVAVESVYSMDGTLCRLAEMADVCEDFGAILSVDEAHAAGIFGPSGAGLVSALSLENRVGIRLVTYGKAFGCHGAAILGSPTLRDYLINYARPLIYSTFTAYHALLSIKAAYGLMPIIQPERDRLSYLIGHFKKRMQTLGFDGLLPSESAIQSLVIPGNEQVRKLASTLQNAGFDARPIVSPTVPKGTERIRLCLHAFNTEAEIDRFSHVAQHATIA